MKFYSVLVLIIYFTIGNSRLNSKFRPISNLRNFKLTRSVKTKIPSGNSGVTVSAPRFVILNAFENVTLWAEKEELIFHLAKLRQKKIKEEFETLNSYIQDYYSTTEILSSSKNLLTTPKERAELKTSGGIASYLMTYRYVHILQRLRERMAFNILHTELHGTLLSKDFSTSAVEQVKHFSRAAGSMSQDWPNIIDLDFAMHSLTHIQEVYDYEYKELPSLLSHETTSAPKLNAFHSAQIGLHALRRKHFAVSIEWVEHAVSMVNNEADGTIPLPLLESYLELVVNLHNKERYTESVSKTNFVENLFVKNVIPFLPSSENNERISNLVFKLHAGRKKPGFESPLFNGVCSGADLRSLRKLSTLYCWYDTSSSPARLIQPYKKERLSFEPEIIQVYDFLGENLISSLLNEKTNCDGIPIPFYKAEFSKMMRLRTPSTCHFEHLSMESFWKRVDSLSLTGPKIGGSHTLQVVDYLFGRLFAVHRDSVQFQSEATKYVESMGIEGDRMITMVAYLNDVPLGRGGTAFPSAGVAAQPIKGSIVFWNNLYRNGSAREDTWHGGCPVVYGHKQIGIILIRSNSQIKAYPCTLNQNE